MCSIVKPQVGILTAVNDQHLALFGSLQNTMQAKYELIDALPKNGLGLLNGNNPNSYKLAKRTKKHHILYVVKHNGMYPDYFSADTHPDVIADDVRVEKSGISFVVRTKEKSLQLRSPLLGAHSIENMLPGIYMAFMLGMKNEEIKQAVKNLTPIEKTMIKKEWKNNIVIIDDTFNSNPEAAVAALRYAQVYTGKRFYVLQPMIELGKKALDEHYRITKEILQSCDYFLLTNNNYAKAIQQAISETNSHCIVKTDNATRLADFIRKTARKGDVIVFEGKESAFVQEKLLHQ
jgi:UDP-N-acetylmuramoyl-tripeptide--D-alanyl-D-alanine ligase